MDNIAIEVNRLRKSFGSLTAVKGIDLQIRDGELFSLLGPNGAGKTTTINMLCCLLRPTGGTATIMGYDIVHHPQRIKEFIGVCPQETAVSERLNCYENLALAGKAHDMDKAVLKQRSDELLEIMGLTERSKEQVKRFSGGMKRRLNLIIALVHDPPILFLDEPTLGLDPQSRRAVWDYIASLKGQKTILLTTHYMEEADALSDRLAIIDEGQIVAQGSPAELKATLWDRKTMVITTEGLSAAALDALRREYPSMKVADEVVELSAPSLDLKEIVDCLHSRGVAVRSAFVKEPTLEDVFISITGKELRD
ncbi:MAG: ABC transporter ATP-binding protein [Chloroflexi bacterium]|nr:MAG: ABC transporter ATP-binding protein [Chloroflexota bacterium]